MALQLVESAFIDGIRYPAIAIVGSVSAPTTTPTPDLEFIESVEDGGFRYPAFVSVGGAAIPPVGGEPLVESVEFNGARYKCIAEADTSLAADEFVSSVVIGSQRFPCAVGVNGSATARVPNTPLTTGVVVGEVHYPAVAFSVGGFKLQPVGGWTGLADCLISPIETGADWALVAGATSECDLNSDGSITQTATNTAQAVIGFKGLTGVDAKCSAIMLYEETTVTRSTFHLAVRATDINNFIALRNYNGELQTYQRVAGAFTQLDDGIVIPNTGTTGKRVELQVVDDVVTVTVDGAVHVMALATTLLTGGSVGFLPRASSPTPITMMKDFRGSIL